jgi:hypothetical protein
VDPQTWTALKGKPDKLLRGANNEKEISKPHSSV